MIDVATSETLVPSTPGVQANSRAKNEILSGRYLISSSDTRSEASAETDVAAETAICSHHDD